MNGKWYSIQMWLLVIEDLAVGGNIVTGWADTRFRILVGKKKIITMLTGKRPQTAQLVILFSALITASLKQIDNI